MLDAPTPFPNIGSYGLLIDEDEPAPQAAELVRIIACRFDGDGAAIALLSFPLREGARGNKEVPLDALIDATPLTIEEQREFHDLDRQLFGRTSFRSKGLKAKEERRETLKRRILWGPFFDRKLKAMRDRRQNAAA
jgi:hypothetical protein